MTQRKRLTINEKCKDGTLKCLKCKQKMAGVFSTSIRDTCSTCGGISKVEARDAIIKN